MNRRYRDQRGDHIEDWFEDYQDGADQHQEEAFIPAQADRQEKSFHTMPAGLPANPSSGFFITEDEIFSTVSPPRRNNIWSIVWSDLMMTMFIFFALMYIFSSMKAESTQKAEPLLNSFSDEKTPADGREQTAPADILTPVPDYYAMTEKTIQAGDLSRLASVELMPDRAVRIILTGDLLFDLGRATLKDDAREQLRALAPVVSRSPYLVNVVGHTDDLPMHSTEFASNWELSVMRACVVARFFIEDMGIPEDKFYLSGHASFQPVKPNSTGENRAANRRVELIMTRNRPPGAPPKDEFLPEDPD